MSVLVLGFDAIDKTKIQLVGGKGANLGELARIEGLNVPAGFCVTTEAFQSVLAQVPELDALIERLTVSGPAEPADIAALCAEIRQTIEAVALPDQLQAEIIRQLATLGERQAYAVRSSATAEDLPTASFAGQQDSYLDLRGRAAILAHISKCWASLFNERAVSYRRQNGFDDRDVQLAVLVQKMVDSEVSGVMFTADPLTANRKVLAINACFGLGEALVSGRVDVDSFRVRAGHIIEQTLVEPATPTLSVARVLQLAELGRRIEAHFGCPQDIEFCLADDRFYFVQSRPITTLFPVPAASDGENRVYVSVGHQQMMTEAFRPLGMSLFLLTTPAPMLAAGGRLFVDCTAQLASPTRRKALFEMMAMGEPLMKDALMTLTERGDFIKTVPAQPQASGQNLSNSEKLAQTEELSRIEADPALPAALIAESQASIAALKREIQLKSGVELLAFIRADLKELKRLLRNPQSLRMILAAMNAAAWLNQKMAAWLGETNVADTLSLSVADNISSEMGLALLDVADAMRPYPELIAYLQALTDQPDPDFLTQMSQFAGGEQARAAIEAYLAKYGMRGSGEIDITQPRWSEQPLTLVPLLLSHIAHFAPHAHHRKFAQLRQVAKDKQRELLERLQALPDSAEKIAETRRMIALLRTFTGYREYPKYSIISRYFIYKQALLKTASDLVDAGLIQTQTDIYYLTFAELEAALRSRTLDPRLIGARKAEYRLNQKLTPPRVITSDGEMFNGQLASGDAPAGALAGIPVSSGIIEGRARVVMKLEAAVIEAGDILVTPFTDPGWTPLFVSIKGLVTEVGGTMTHGAVVAREYALPAVVSVAKATRLIKDGQRIRVNGTVGYVELL